MKVLIFLPSSNFALDIISKAIFLNENGYQVFFLSTSPKGIIHNYLELKGINSFSLNIKNLSSKNYLRATFNFIGIVRKYRINYVVSNNLQGNFIAVIAQLFHRKRTLLTRHHSDYIYKGNNKNAKFQQRFVNRFGKEFIAISDRVKEQMLIEGIIECRIHRINLGFDFDLFPIPNEEKVKQLTHQFENHFKLCVVARLIPLKRHLLLFEAIETLILKGENIVLWVIGEGPLMSELVDWVVLHKLEKNIQFTGYVENTQDYIKASDLLVHISESEASSHVIREASLYEAAALVCKDVGDFDDYIVDNYNGFLINKDLDGSSLAKKVEAILEDKELSLKAKRLEKSVRNRFDILINGKSLLKLLISNSLK